MVTIPEQRDRNDDGPSFEATLWAAFATAEGIPAGHATAPVPADWFTGNACLDAERAEELVDAAFEAADAADGRYEDGEGSWAAVADARAHVVLVQAFAAYMAAVAEACAVAA